MQGRPNIDWKQALYCALKTRKYANLQHMYKASSERRGNLIISEPNLNSFVQVIEGVHSIAHGKMACSRSIEDKHIKVHIFGKDI